MDKACTLKAAQQTVDDWVQQFQKPYFGPLSCLACLIEEVGELARILNRLYGDKGAKTDEDLKNLEDEIGDLLFSIICLANRENIDLEAAFRRNMDKNTNRDTDRFEKTAQ